MRIAAGATIYLAARFERQAEIKVIAALLRAHGFVVTSRWLEVDGLSVGTDRTERYALMDLEDVRAAQTLILFTETARVSRGGKDAEFGMAVGWSHTVIVCGPRVNVFHHLPQVVWHPTLASLLEWLGVAEKVEEIGAS